MTKRPAGPAFLALATIVLLAGCTSGGGIEPIPGSITYGGQPRSKLQRAPAGSTFTHEMRDAYGHRSQEIYRVEADRSLTLLSRQRIDPDD